MHQAISALYHPDNKNRSCYIKLQYLEADFALVGFNGDGVQSADNDFLCAVGEDCVEEHCGIDDNIIKPYECGTGPCICLCNGGRVGDVDGDDCMETGSKCRKFTPEISSKFNTFYFLDTDRGECDMQNTLSDIKKPGSLCDLVLPSEECNGRNKNVIHKLVITKTVSVSAGGLGYATVFDQVKDEEEFKRYYPEDIPECSVMARNLFAPVKEAPKEETSEENKGEGKQESELDKIQKIDIK